MLQALLNRAVLPAVLLAGFNTWAQTNNAPAAEPAPVLGLEATPPPRLNRIGLSYAMGVNISVDFRKLGGLQLTDPGPVIGGAVNRNYDDGYNRVDISGNAGNRTWYWGYSSPQSLQGDHLVLQSDSTPATAHSGEYQHRPQSGVELTYNRELTRGKRWRVGLEGAFGYMALSFRDNQTLHYFVDRTSDSFALNGVIPPQPPYNGTFQGPGPIISSAPSGRSVATLSDAATITGERTLDCDLFTLRFGPYFEVPLTRKLILSLGGGLTLAWADSQFSFQEQVFISDPLYGINLASGPRSGGGSQTDFLVGGYGGGSLGYDITERVRLLAGVLYQAAGRAVGDHGGKQSVLDLGKSVIFTVGASYAF
jgi:hypothetical protein